MRLSIGTSTFNNKNVLINKTLIYSENDIQISLDYSFHGECLMDYTVVITKIGGIKKKFSNFKGP